MQKKTLQALLSAVIGSIRLLDVDGAILAADPLSAECSDKCRTGLSELNVFSLLPPERAAVWRKNFRKAARTRRSVGFTEEGGAGVWKLPLPCAG
jgi:hypothetical protein